MMISRVFMVRTVHRPKVCTEAGLRLRQGKLLRFVSTRSGDAHFTDVDLAVLR